MTESDRRVLESWGKLEPKHPITESPPVKKPVKVWLAVLLNLFPLIMGLGYIYKEMGPVRCCNHSSIIYPRPDDLARPSSI